jgi:flagellar biosynthesis/type III secretory pathway M-ring protein FliF/YscJ
MPLTSGKEGGREIGAGAARGALSAGAQEDLQSLARQEPQRAAQAIKLWLVQE